MLSLSSFGGLGFRGFGLRGLGALGLRVPVKASFKAPLTCP